jgi:hypothetical protein
MDIAEESTFLTFNNTVLLNGYFNTNYGPKSYVLKFNSTPGVFPYPFSTNL